MIDVLGTLAVHGGLSRAFAINPPEPPVELLWRTVVELDEPWPPTGAPAADQPLSARHVGAYGHSRADSMVRGAGEAVERAALHPGRGTLRGARRARPGELDALPYADPDVGLAAPHLVEHDITWYEGRRLSDGSPTPVPAGLVDWPGPCDGLFDPGPSGAASGAGLDMAVRAALLEVVERDAVLVAWERGLRLPQVDLGTAHGQEARALSRLRATAEEAGLGVHLAQVPTAVPGVFCCVAVVVDATARTAVGAVGCKASPDPVRSALGALQEGLQVRALLRNMVADGSAPAAPERISDEDARLTFLLSTEGSGSVRAWAESFTDPVVPPAPAELATSEIVDALLSDGCDPVVVDLSGRLPDRLRRMGWAAVKVVPVGYQQLRMDEELEWSWNRRRLLTAEQRTGLAARFAPGDRRRPHPLP